MEHRKGAMERRTCEIERGKGATEHRKRAMERRTCEMERGERAMERRKDAIERGKGPMERGKGAKPYGTADVMRAEELCADAEELVMHAALHCVHAQNRCARARLLRTQAALHSVHAEPPNPAAPVMSRGTRLLKPEETAAGRRNSAVWATYARRDGRRETLAALRIDTLINTVGSGTLVTSKLCVSLEPVCAIPERFTIELPPMLPSMLQAPSARPNTCTLYMPTKGSPISYGSSRNGSAGRGTVISSSGTIKSASA